MVGYAGPCPCCSGVKRRRAEMGSSESFPSPGSLPDTPPAKIPRLSPDSSAASAAESEREEKAAKPAPVVVNVGPDQEDETSGEAASTEAVAAMAEAVKAAAVLSVESMAEEAEKAEEPASADSVPEQKTHSMALLEAAIGEEELVVDEAEKADEPAAATRVPEQEPETKASAEAALEEVTEKQESDDKAMPEAATSEKAELASPLALSDSDHGDVTRQGPEAASVTAAKASGENGAAEEAASPAPAKARPRLTAEVRMPNGVHVDISFRCKCGGLCREIAIA